MANQARPLPVVLHSFGGYRETQRVREVRDQAHDGAVHLSFPEAVDEGLVDLPAVHQEALHVVQRRVAAAEVVEGYAHPEGTQIPEDAGNLQLVLHHHGLRDLRLQLVRTE
jgi:hypothetical protein